MSDNGHGTAEALPHHVQLIQIATASWASRLLTSQRSWILQTAWPADLRVPTRSQFRRALTRHLSIASCVRSPASAC
jgi:hypothetical protein